MNYRLLVIFLIFQVIEFSTFYGLAVLLSSQFDLSAIRVFLSIVGIDIISTVIVFSKSILHFADSLFNDEQP
jgi:hypothetical protein